MKDSSGGWQNYPLHEAVIGRDQHMVIHRVKGHGRNFHRPLKVLVVDVGGTHVKILATGKRVPRKIASGPTMTARQMVQEVQRLAADWSYEAISGKSTHMRITSACGGSKDTA